MFSFLKSGGFGHNVISPMNNLCHGLDDIREKLYGLSESVATTSDYIDHACQTSLSSYHSSFADEFRQADERFAETTATSPISLASSSSSSEHSRQSSVTSISSQSISEAVSQALAENNKEWEKTSKMHIEEAVSKAIARTDEQWLAATAHTVQSSNARAEAAEERVHELHEALIPYLRELEIADRKYKTELDSFHWLATASFTALTDFQTSLWEHGLPVPLPQTWLQLITLRALPMLGMDERCQVTWDSKWWNSDAFGALMTDLREKELVYAYRSAPGIDLEDQDYHNDSPASNASQNRPDYVKYGILTAQKPTHVTQCSPEPFIDIEKAMPTMEHEYRSPSRAETGDNPHAYIEVAYANMGAEVKVNAANAWDPPDTALDDDFGMSGSKVTIDKTDKPTMETANPDLITAPQSPQIPRTCSESSIPQEIAAPSTLISYFGQPSFSLDFSNTKFHQGLAYPSTAAHEPIFSSQRLSQGKTAVVPNISGTFCVPSAASSESDDSDYQRSEIVSSHEEAVACTSGVENADRLNGEDTATNNVLDVASQSDSGIFKSSSAMIASFSPQPHSPSSASTNTFNFSPELSPPPPSLPSSLPTTPNEDIYVREITTPCHPHAHEKPISPVKQTEAGVSSKNAKKYAKKKEKKQGMTAEQKSVEGLKRKAQKAKARAKKADEAGRAVEKF